VHAAGGGRQHRTAYLVMQSQSIMDYVQQLFSFFIAPLFGTVLLACCGSGLPRLAASGIVCRHRFLGRHVAWVKVDPQAVKYVALSLGAQDQAQNMFRALWCWLICVLVTVVVSLVTKPKPDAELTGLVYGLTAIPQEERVSLLHRPVFWAVIVAIVFVILNIIFW